MNPPKRQGAGLDKNTKLALRELQKALSSLYGEKTPRIVVYGSTAREQATDSSDVDVMLLYPSRVQPGREIARLSAILADLNLRYQVLISVVPASEEEYRETLGSFWSNVRKEGIPIDAI